MSKYFPKTIDDLTFKQANIILLLLIIIPIVLMYISDNGQEYNKARESAISSFSAKSEINNFLVMRLNSCGEHGLSRAVCFSDLIDLNQQSKFSQSQIKVAIDEYNKIDICTNQNISTFACKGDFGSIDAFSKEKGQK